MSKFLDDSGLTYFYGKLKAIFIRGVQVNGSDLTPSNVGKVNVLIQESTNNGKIKVNNVDVDIHGLGSAAYTASTDYDAAGAASAAVAALTIPTDTSDLTNGAGFQTSSDVTSAINSAISGITGIDFQIVASYSDLPATGTKGVIYLVPNSGTAPNVYDEYIWVTPTSGTAGYEKIGSTAVDLTGYWQHNNSSSNDYLAAMTTAEIDAAIAAA